jgi:hypothetical protein
MSQRSQSRPFDVIVVVLFVFIAGFFALRSRAPEQPSIPGVTWPAAPQSGSLDDAKSLLDPPASLTEETTSSEGVPAQPEAAPAEQGSWE